MRTPNFAGPPPPPHARIVVDDAPTTDDAEAGGVLLFTSLVAGIAAIMFGTMSLALWFAPSEWAALSMPLALLAIVLANVVLVVWWFLGNIDIRIHVIGLTLGVAGGLGWFVRSGEIQKVLAGFGVTKNDKAQKPKRVAEKQPKPEAAKKAETNDEKPQADQNEDAKNASGREIVPSNAQQKASSRRVPEVAENRKPEESRPVKTSDVSKDTKIAPSADFKGNGQTERAVHLSQVLSSWKFRSEDISVTQLFTKGKFKFEMRGAGYRDFVEAVDRKDRLAAFSKLTGMELAELPPNSEIDEALSSDRISNSKNGQASFLIFVDKQGADLKAINAKEDWKILIVHFPSLTRKVAGGERIFQIAEVFDDWKLHPDGIGWSLPWNPTWDSVVVAIGPPKILKDKIKITKGQLQSLLDSLIAKQKLGEIEPAEIEKRIRELYEGKQTELREFVLKGR